ncbi:MAG: hypothetical protein DIU62_009410 [Pseudomonadota bacterium]
MASSIKPLVALCAALFLAACASAPRPQAQLRVEPFQPGPRPGEIIHRDSGIHFPARIGSFARFAGHQYDAEGRDISVGYSGDIPSVVTVYVFPAGEEDIETALVRQSADVLIAYPGAQVTGRRKVKVTPEAIEAEAVSFSFSTRFQGSEQPVHSELVLARHGGRYIKYRITYPADIADIAGEDSEKFLQHFSWPWAAPSRLPDSLRWPDGQGRIEPGIGAAAGGACRLAARGRVARGRRT